MEAQALDLELLLRLRVVIARVGERDLANWWNTNKQLGPTGPKVLRRGFPRTHYFAQARSVFAVARQRCAERFPLATALHLFQLPEVLEEEFDARWEYWLDDASSWAPFFEAVAQLDSADPLVALEKLGLLDAQVAGQVSNLKVQAEGRAVQLPSAFLGTTQELGLLAAGFARGAHGELVVPYTELVRK